MASILAGHNHMVLRYSIVVIVLFAVWTHWRAAYTPDVRAALGDLPAGMERLDDIVQDVRDRRLIHHCRAVLTDLCAGDQASFEEHRSDALSRIDHLERFAPLRRFTNAA